MIPAAYEFRELDYCPIKKLFEMNKVLIVMTQIFAIEFNDSQDYYDPWVCLFTNSTFW